MYQLTCAHCTKSVFDYELDLNLLCQDCRSNRNKLRAPGITVDNYLCGVCQKEIKISQDHDMDKHNQYIRENIR